MRSTILMTLFFSISVISFAQNKANISGKVVENGSGKAMPFVQVVLTSADENTIVAGNLSDEYGRFSISGISPGSYVVRCSFIGYAFVKIPIFIGKLNNNYDLGSIELKLEAIQSDEVIVEAQRAILSAGLDIKRFIISSWRFSLRSSQNFARCNC